MGRGRGASYQPPREAPYKPPFPLTFVCKTGSLRRGFPQGWAYRPFATLSRYSVLAHGSTPGSLSLFDPRDRALEGVDDIGLPGAPVVVGLHDVDAGIAPHAPLPAHR